MAAYAGVSFWSDHDADADPATAISNTTDGAWPVAERLGAMLASG